MQIDLICMDKYNGAEKLGRIESNFRIGIDNISDWMPANRQFISPVIKPINSIRLMGLGLLLPSNDSIGEEIDRAIFPALIPRL